MAKHNEVLKSFQAMVPVFDVDNKEHKDMVSRPNISVNHQYYRATCIIYVQLGTWASMILHLIHSYM